MIHDNSLTVLAVEMLCATQAIHLRKVPTSKALQAAIAVIRRDVPPLDADRVTALDIQKVREHLASGEIVKAVETEVKTLN